MPENKSINPVVAQFMHHVDVMNKKNGEIQKYFNTHQDVHLSASQQSDEFKKKERKRKREEKAHARLGLSGLAK